MKVMLLGSSGLIGTEISSCFKKHFDFFGFSKEEIDICSLKILTEKFDNISPDILINAAAFTNVDQCEVSKEESKKINSESLIKLIPELERRKISLIHFSSDYVFDGESKIPYLETDKTNPINHYGETKAIGDFNIMDSRLNAMVLRTSWVYGKKGANFSNKILEKAFYGNEIQVVSDEQSVPTSAKFIADVLLKILKNNSILGREIYNIVPNGIATRLDFAQKLLKEAENRKLNTKTGYDEIVPINSEKLKMIAKRPKFSVLDNRKIKEKFNLEFKNWDAYLGDLFN